MKTPQEWIAWRREEAKRAMDDDRHEMAAYHDAQGDAIELPLLALELAVGIINTSAECPEQVKTPDYYIELARAELARRKEQGDD